MVLSDMGPFSNCSLSIKSVVITRSFSKPTCQAISRIQRSAFWSTLLKPTNTSKSESHDASPLAREPKAQTCASENRSWTRAQNSLRIFQSSLDIILIASLNLKSLSFHTKFFELNPSNHQNLMIAEIQPVKGCQNGKGRSDCIGGSSCKIIAGDGRWQKEYRQSHCLIIYNGTGNNMRLYAVMQPGRYENLIKLK